MAPVLRSRNKRPRREYPPGYKPRNPIEELDMLDELTDSEEELSDEDLETSDETGEETGEAENEEQGTQDAEDAPAAPSLPSVRRGILVPESLSCLSAIAQCLPNDGITNVVPIYLTNPGAFDCQVCYDTLSIPIYQCVNGHVVCGPCFSKIERNCPFCSGYMGENRCRAMETALESMNSICGNAKFGCRERMLYSKKCEHEKTCGFSQLNCPMPTCNWSSSLNQLPYHLSHDHAKKIIRFQYGKFFNVTLRSSQRFIFLQASSSDEKLFLVHSQIGVRGNHVSLRHIGPSMLLPEEILYEVIKMKTKEVLLPPTSVKTADETDQLGHPMLSLDIATFYITRRRFSRGGCFRVRFKITPNVTAATPSGEGPSAPSGEGPSTSSRA